ncbi:MAG: CCA tRNA nucleotidyltransferase [Cyanobacteriota bacterium]|nr:CCA tRNA nucleotidyltransferase [Cyanobacteriota bacterium]
MHIPSPAASEPILERDQQAVSVWQRLAPERWPLPLDRLPQGTALVGGAVRDAWLNRLQQEPDLDLVVPSDALGLTRRLAKDLDGTVVVLDEKRDMARLVLRGWTVDIARQDGLTLEEDLQRRDYRLNAIAMTLQPPLRLVDPTGGLTDLSKGRLSAVRESNLTDDPLRLLRGLRLMAEIPLQADATTTGWIHRHRHRLAEAAPERILAELQKLVAGPHAEQALRLLIDLELVSPWGAEKDLLCREDAALLTQEERSQALPLARLSRLISAEGLNRLRASRNLQERCRRLRHWRQTLQKNHDALSEQDQLELHLDLGTDLPALIVQLDASLQADWLQRWRDPTDPLFHPKAPVDGTTLQQELNLAPGPQLGALLRHLLMESAFGRIKGSEDALVEAQRWCVQDRCAL